MSIARGYCQCECSQATSIVKWSDKGDNDSRCLRSGKGSLMKKTTKDSLDRYAEHGIPTGGFLRAVLANDLMEAFGRADTENRQDMFEIVGHVYNEMPSPCHGSYEIVDEWIEAAREKRESRTKVKS